MRAPALCHNPLVMTLLIQVQIHLQILIQAEVVLDGALPGVFLAVPGFPVCQVVPVDQAVPVVVVVAAAAAIPQ